MEGWFLIEFVGSIECFFLSRGQTCFAEDGFERFHLLWTSTPVLIDIVHPCALQPNGASASAWVALGALLFGATIKRWWGEGRGTSAGAVALKIIVARDLFFHERT